MKNSSISHVCPGAQLIEYGHLRLPIEWSLGALLASARFDCVDSDIVRGAFSLESRICDRVDVAMASFNIDGDTTPRKIQTLVGAIDSQNRWFPAWIGGLILFGAAYPDAQREYGRRINALGNRRTARADAHTLIPHLESHCHGKQLLSVRALNCDEEGDDFFLVVRPKPQGV
jgi:hypothetical protein